MGRGRSHLMTASYWKLVIKLKEVVCSSAKQAEIDHSQFTLRSKSDSRSRYRNRPSITQSIKSWEKKINICQSGSPESVSDTAIVNREATEANEHQKGIRKKTYTTATSAFVCVCARVFVFRMRARVRAWVCVSEPANHNRRVCYNCCTTTTTITDCAY